MEGVEERIKKAEGITKRGGQDWGRRGQDVDGE